MAEEDSVFLKLPREVLYDCLFPLLHVNDLVRLRRVNKQIKILSDDFLRNHPTDQEREINETEHTVKDFIQLNLATSKLFINNTGPEFFSNPNISEFLQLYATKITHLRVRYFSTCISEPENTFFLALTNLQHLELEFTDARARNLAYGRPGMSMTRVPREPCYFPPNFRNLKTLKLNEIQTSTVYDHGYAWDIFRYCSNVEYLKHPLHKNWDQQWSDYGEGPLGCVIEMIGERSPERKLKYYDLQNHNNVNDPWIFGLSCLSKLSVEKDIKLLNVDAALFGPWDSESCLQFRRLAKPLVSVKNVNFFMFLFDLPNLEEVIITSTDNCNFCRVQPPREWPKLRVLDITVDSKISKMSTSSRYPSHITRELLDFFFAYGEREQLRDLRFRFGVETAPPEGTCLPSPRVEDIAQSCSNLTKLTLSNWFDNDQDLSRLWGSLLLLEEVTFERCKVLNDKTFLGGNEESPAFLKLTNLKKLTLKELDAMPKITDSTFHLVFRHLKIKEFHITSMKSLHSVTKVGIRSLLTGEFNKTVERFPFNGWSLEHVTHDEFSNLKCEFRAYYML